MHFSSLKPFTLVVFFLLYFGVYSTEIFGQTDDAPVPRLRYLGSNDTTWQGQNLRMYKFEVENRTEFPQELFEAAPDLPPCGLNNNSSRTWLHILDAATKRYIYGFCGIKDTSELGKIWFSRSVEQTQPESVYIEMTDRHTGRIYRSDVVAIGPTDTRDGRMNDRREIEILEAEWNRINELSDAEGKIRLLAHNSYHIGPSGRYYNKAQDVTTARASRNAKEASGTVTKFLISDQVIRMYDGAAVVTGRGVSVVTKDGHERNGGPFRFVHVWEKREGRWQLVVDQVTGIQKN